MAGFKTIERKYGVSVVSEGYHWNGNRMIETFMMLTKDGCCWEKGMSRKRVKAECEEWSRELLAIRNR